MYQVEKEESAAAVEEAPFQPAPVVPSTDWTASPQVDTVTDGADWATMSESKDVSISNVIILLCTGTLCIYCDVRMSCLYHKHLMKTYFYCTYTKFPSLCLLCAGN